MLSTSLNEVDEEGADPSDPEKRNDIPDRRTDCVGSFDVQLTYFSMVMTTI